jgi:hypothetical protein
MKSMWTDPGSSAPFNPGSQSASMQAYSIFSTCGLGAFQNESSVGGEVQCPPCQEIGNCTFDQISPASYVCSRCQTCNRREYVASWSLCDGRRQDPFIPECRTCKGQCAVGQYINDTCTGSTEYNTETCVNCTSCPVGFYHANHSGYNAFGEYVEEPQACNGTGVIPSDGNSSCRRCDVCPNGQYAR